MKSEDYKQGYKDGYQGRERRISFEEIKAKSYHIIGVPIEVKDYVIGYYDGEQDREDGKEANFI